MRGLPVWLGAVLLVAGCTSAVAGRPGSAGSPTSTLPTTSAAAATASTSAAPRPKPRPKPHPATTRPARQSTPPAPLPAPTVTFPAGSGPLIALNPGHNGANGSHPAEINRLVPAGFGRMKACDTTGTTTNAGYPEHAFNWDVTLRVRAILQQHGVRVILTRPSDNGVGPCVDQRAAIGNQPGVQAVVSIHADGAPAEGHGFHICEDSRPPAGPRVAARSHALTVAVHDALVRRSGFVTSTYLGTNGYYPRDDLAGLNLATVPATFIELGNMRNAGDAALQSSPSGRARIAAAVAAGILAYLAR